MAYLTIRIRDQEGHSQEDLGLERNVVGRNEDADVVIKHESISRQHCAFVRVEDRWYVEDLGSSNGTRLNNEKIDGRQPLTERDIVKIGKARLTFHAGERGKKKAKSVDADGLQLSKDALGDGGNAEVREVTADDPQEAIPCSHCGTWVSIAHRLAGDRMNCPACSRSLSVPQLIS